MAAAHPKTYKQLSPRICDACATIAVFRLAHPDLDIIQRDKVGFAGGDKRAIGAFRTRHPHP